jgi:hypothetical protein
LCENVGTDDVTIRILCLFVSKNVTAQTQNMINALPSMWVKKKTLASLTSGFIILLAKPEFWLAYIGGVESLPTPLECFKHYPIICELPCFIFYG